MRTWTGELSLGSFRRTSLCRAMMVAIMIAIMGAVAVGSPAQAQAAQILIVDGTDSYAITAGTTLETELTTAGNTVTRVDTAVPASLTAYTQIYDLRYNNLPAFTTGEQAQYLAFLQTAANNTLFLMGENNSFNARNGPILNFVASAGGGTIASPTSQSSVAETVNSLFTTPNSITTVKFAACGLVTSTGTGAFATSEPAGTTGCSLFFGLGALANAPNAALVVVFDVNFIYDAQSRAGSVPATNEIAFRQNMEAFVSAPPVAPPPVPELPPWALGVLGLLLPASALLVLRRRTRGLSAQSQ
jgi:hypothetical protein